MFAAQLNTTAFPTSLSRKQLWIGFATGALVVGSLWAALLSNTAFRLGSFTGYLLLQLLFVVSYTDLKERKIPNWATYTSFVIAIAINALASMASSMDVSALGAVGIGNSLAGGLGMLTVMLAIFSLTGGGAGDVKLAACIGALLGWQRGVDAVLFSFMVGGACVLAYSIWTRGPFYLAKALFCSVGHFIFPAWIPKPDKSEKSLLTQKLPLAPFFAVGTLLAVYRDHVLFLGN